MLLICYRKVRYVEMETNLTLKFKGVEAKLLEEVIKRGLFSSKSEAIRAALINYFLELGLLQREQLWKEIQNTPRRKVTAEKLAKDLEIIEDEI